jgi:hypothetical protein
MQFFGMHSLSSTYTADIVSYFISHYLFNPIFADTCKGRILL